MSINQARAPILDIASDENITKTTSNSKVPPSAAPSTPSHDETITTPIPELSRSDCNPTHNLPTSVSSSIDVCSSPKPITAPISRCITEANYRLLCEHPLGSATNCKFYTYSPADLNSHYKLKHGCLLEDVEAFLAATAAAQQKKIEARKMKMKQVIRAFGRLV